MKANKNYVFFQLIQDCNFEQIADELKIVDPQWRQRLWRYRELLDRLKKNVEPITVDKPIVIEVNEDDFGYTVRGAESRFKDMLLGQQVILNGVDLKPEAIIANVLYAATCKGVSLNQHEMLRRTPLMERNAYEKKATEISERIHSHPEEATGLDNEFQVAYRLGEMIRAIQATTKRSEDIDKTLDFLPKVDRIKYFGFHSVTDNPDERVNYIKKSVLRYSALELLGTYTHFVFLVTTDKNHKVPGILKQIEEIADTLLVDEDLYEKMIVLEGREWYPTQRMTLHLWAMRVPKD